MQEEFCVSYRVEETIIRAINEKPDYMVILFGISE